MQRNTSTRRRPLQQGRWEGMGAWSDRDAHVDEDDETATIFLYRSFFINYLGMRPMAVRVPKASESKGRERERRRPAKPSALLAPMLLSSRRGSGPRRRRATAV